MNENLVEKKKRKSSRELILKEAFKLFLQKNVEKVTVPEIEKATGVKRGAIFYHFEDKKALFIEVIEKYFFSELNIFYPINPYGISSLEEYIQNKNRHLDYIMNWFINEGLNINPYTSFYHLCFQAYLYYPSFKNRMFYLMKLDKVYWQKATEIDKFEYSGIFLQKHSEFFRSAYLERCFSACYCEMDNMANGNCFENINLHK